MGVTTAVVDVEVDVDVDVEVDVEVDAVDDVPYVHVVQSTAGQLILACFLGTGLKRFWSFWSFWSWEQQGAFFVQGILLAAKTVDGDCKRRLMVR